MPRESSDHSRRHRERRDQQNAPYTMTPSKHSGHSRPDLPEYCYRPKEPSLGRNELDDIFNEVIDGRALDWSPPHRRTDRNDQGIYNTHYTHSYSEGSNILAPSFGRSSDLRRQETSPQYHQSESGDLGNTELEGCHTQSDHYHPSQQERIQPKVVLEQTPIEDGPGTSAHSDIMKDGAQLDPSVFSTSTSFTPSLINRLKAPYDPTRIRHNPRNSVFIPKDNLDQDHFRFHGVDWVKKVREGEDGIVFSIKANSKCPGVNGEKCGIDSEQILHSWQEDKINTIETACKSCYTPENHPVPVCGKKEKNIEFGASFICDTLGTKPDRRSKKATVYCSKHAKRSKWQADRRSS